MDKFILNGNVAVDAISAKEGDTVLVATTVSGDKLAVPLTSIRAGDSVAVVKLQNGDKMAVKVASYDTCVKVTDGFSRAVSATGEVVDLGTFTFNWDGKGTVILDAYCPLISVRKFWVDDSITITTAKGSLSFDHMYFDFYGSPDITSILSKGINKINVSVNDVYGAKVGCSRIFIVPISD
ncbi:MAG: hypothetical protein K8E24_003240 [Methanobacterium paludis]|nr:hypothetical protein [Methanobacterium paludis]